MIISIPPPKKITTRNIPMEFVRCPPWVLTHASNASCPCPVWTGHVGYNIALGATSRSSYDWPTALVLLEELGDMAVGVHGVPGGFLLILMVGGRYQSRYRNEWYIYIYNVYTYIIHACMYICIYKCNITWYTPEVILYWFSCWNPMAVLRDLVKSRTL